MSNDTSRKPWSLDTAAVITTARVRVQSLRWVTDGSVGDQLHVEDANGEIIWRSWQVTANYIDADYPYADFEGFELAKIDSGILYVTLG